MSDRKRSRLSRRTALASLGVAGVGLAAAWVLLGVQSRPTSTAVAAPSTDAHPNVPFQPTQYENVLVRSIPARPQTAKNGQAWIYVKPGAARPVAVGARSAPKQGRTEIRSDGTVLVHYGKNLMFPSTAHRDKAGKVVCECAQNNAAGKPTSHRH